MKSIYSPLIEAYYNIKAIFPLFLQQLEQRLPTDRVSVPFAGHLNRMTLRKQFPYLQMIQIQNWSYMDMLSSSSTPKSGPITSRLLEDVEVSK